LSGLRFVTSPPNGGFRQIESMRPLQKIF